MKKLGSITLAMTTAVLISGCEGRRSLDNPDNLDNMPVQDERVEDTADLHHTTGTVQDGPDNTTGTTTQ